MIPWAEPSLATYRRRARQRAVRGGRGPFRWSAIWPVHDWRRSPARVWWAKTTRPRSWDHGNTQRVRATARWGRAALRSPGASAAAHTDTEPSD